MLLFLLFITCNIFAGQIDVVVPIHEKDTDRIEGLIENLRENVVDIGDIYFISKERYTDEVAWIDEAAFPFSIDDVGNELGGMGGVGKHNRRGWYLQQLLKFYAPSIIEGISENILIFDADTLITRPTKFIDDDGKIFLCIENRWCKIPTYYAHMKVLYPELDEVDMTVNPVVNFAMFSKSIIAEMMASVEERFELPFWKVFCHKVNLAVYKPHTRGFNAGASEYMIYYHYCMHHHRDEVTPKFITISNRCTAMVKREISDRFDFKTIHNLNP